MLPPSAPPTGQPVVLTPNCEKPIISSTRRDATVHVSHVPAYMWGLFLISYSVPLMYLSLLDAITTFQKLLQLNSTGMGKSMFIVVCEENNRILNN